MRCRERPFCGEISQASATPLTTRLLATLPLLVAALSSSGEETGPVSRSDGAPRVFSAAART